MTKSNPCACEKCQDRVFRLHIGDRVSISGQVDPTVRAIFQTRLAEKGVRVQGQVTRQSNLLVISEPGEASKSHDLAKEFNVKVCQPYELDLLTDDIAPNGRIIFPPSTSRFEDLPISGKRVFILGLPPENIAWVQSIVEKRGGSIAQQLRESLAALIIGPESLGLPQVLIAKAYGIPVFLFDELDLSI